MEEQRFPARMQKPLASDFAQWMFDLCQPKYRRYKNHAALLMGKDGERNIESNKLWANRHYFPKPENNRVEGWKQLFSDPLDESRKGFEASSLTVNGKPLKCLPDVVLFKESTSGILIIERKIIKAANIPESEWSNIKAQLWCYSWIDEFQSAIYNKRESMPIRSFISLVIGVLFVLLLSACGNDSNTTIGSGAKSPLPKVTENSGMLRIATDPGDAQIFINGHRKGNSSPERNQAFSIKLGQGRYVIEALIPSQGTEEQYAKREDVFVADGTVQSLSLELKPRRSESFRTELLKKYGGKAIEPPMVVIPADSFTMGSPDHEPERGSREGPQRQVHIAAFEMGKHEVTFDEWDACVADLGCQHWPVDAGWGRGKRPVINVSFDDITNEYIPWLNRKTGKQYRLPSEAEWEYAARAGTTTRFHTGDCITTAQANFKGTIPVQGCPKGEYRQQTLPVGSLVANAFGLYDMHGNVWEWTQDCENERHSGAPSTGAARTDGDCDMRILRGGSLARADVRAASRHAAPRDDQNADLGFRLARTR